MKRLLLAALACLLLACTGSEPPLTIHLRCGGISSGSLSISLAGDVSPPTNFDLKTACPSGKIVWNAYRPEASLLVKIDLGDGRTNELAVRYGPNIKRDQHGFYTVLKLTPAPPFLANDSI